MDYENERWMKVYTRDTGGWLDLSWQARGLSLELSRKLDAEGKLPLGKKGLPSLAGLLRGVWSEMKPFIEELIADERLVLLEGNVIFDPGHAERQSARASATLRKKVQRSRDAMSRDVTRSHAESREVTNGHDQIRSDQRDQIRSEEIRKNESERAPPTPLAVQAEPVKRAPRSATEDSGPPDWWEPALATIHMSTGIELPSAEAWLRYAGHRSGKGIATSTRDAQYWLTTVMVPEVRNAKAEAARRDARDGERTAAFVRERHGPEVKPLPSVTPLMRERDAWVKTAATPEEQAASARELQKLLGGIGR